MAKPVLILVVEDDELISVVLEEGFKDAGYDLTFSSDGAAAVSKLEADPAAISALVTDIHLGRGLDGWDVARRARELAPDLPVVYMTADGGSEWTSRGVPNSVLVLKPFAVGQIVTAVSTLLNDLATHRAGGA